MKTIPEISLVWVAASLAVVFILLGVRPEPTDVAGLDAAPVAALAADSRVASAPP